MYIYMYICVGGWGVSPAGPPVTGKSFRVVPCVRTCVRAVLGLVRFQPNRRTCPFPFPFYRAGFSLFPFAPPAFPFSLVQAHVPFSLVSTVKKWIQMKSSEFTWNQMKSRDIEWNDMNSNELKWIEVKSNEINWIQMTSSEFKWNQMNSNGIKWN